LKELENNKLTKITFKNSIVIFFIYL